MPVKKVLIIDDEEKLRSLLARIISLEGFEVIQAEDRKTALKKLEQNNIDVILSDVKLPDGNGVELTLEIKKLYPSIEIIVLTAYGNIQDGVKSIQNGAFDYITKGDDNNRIIPLLHRAMEKSELSNRVLSLERQLGEKKSFDTIIGHSKTLMAAIDLARKVAITDTTVLLTGETGTGKEIFAESIHRASTRSAKNFIAINCSAFSRELLESEMFGHKAGAFTGAVRDKKGLFEEADKGTIFLDEIGEMALDLQAKLLRVIESGEFIKIGESKVTKINVRIIAATNRDLLSEISKGNFRQDLFYRISAFRIELPSLNERIEDIEILAQYFLDSFNKKTAKKIKNISPAYIKALKHHRWNGNIRELKNVIERSVILTNENELIPESLPYEFDKLSSSDETNNSLELATTERLHILKVLLSTNGNKTRTAELLGIALTTLYRKLEEYKINN